MHGVGFDWKQKQSINTAKQTNGVERTKKNQQKSPEICRLYTFIGLYLVWSCARMAICEDTCVKTIIQFHQFLFSAVRKRAEIRFCRWRPFLSELPLFGFNWIYF